MSVIEIENIKDPAIAPFSSLTERQLRNYDSEGGVFIVESPKVIKVALESGYEPVSLLCERKHITGDASQIIASNPDMPVFTGSREILAQLTGYTLTRGVLCAMKRKENPSPVSICEMSRRVVVIEAVCDTTNIGSIFRSAAALGIDGILLTPDSCDPFNRRSIRVSMGTVFKIPWAFTSAPIEVLKDSGYTTVALTLHKDSLAINDPIFKQKGKLTLVLGTEGDGLSNDIISKCDYKAIIPMYHNIDSLNVGAAAAIAFWELKEKGSHP